MPKGIPNYGYPFLLPMLHAYGIGKMASCKLRLENAPWGKSHFWEFQILKSRSDETFVAKRLRRKFF